MTYIKADTKIPVLLTSNIDAVSFTPEHWKTDASETNQITINVPTTRYNQSQALSLDGENFIVENCGMSDVIISVADGWHYINSIYHQTYIRHILDYDDQGIGVGEPVTYTIPPFTSVKVFIKTQYNLDNAAQNIIRVVYHVVKTSS